MSFYEYLWIEKICHEIFIFHHSLLTIADTFVNAAVCVTIFGFDLLFVTVTVVSFIIIKSCAHNYETMLEISLSFTAFYQLTKSKKQNT